MSTTTPNGPVIRIAKESVPVEESETEHVHSHHAAVSHTHANTGPVTEADIPDDLGLKNVQISQSGTYDAQLAVEKPGLVAEDVTVTEMLDVIDDAFIRVQPNPDVHQSAVLIGFNPESMTANDTGVFVHRGKNVITINHRVSARRITLLRRLTSRASTTWQRTTT